MRFLKKSQEWRSGECAGVGMCRRYTPPLLLLLPLQMCTFWEICNASISYLFCDSGPCYLRSTLRSLTAFTATAILANLAIHLSWQCIGDAALWLTAMNRCFLNRFLPVAANFTSTTSKVATAASNPPTYAINMAFTLPALLVVDCWLSLSSLCLFYRMIECCWHHRHCCCSCCFILCSFLWNFLSIILSVLVGPNGHV